MIYNHFFQQNYENKRYKHNWILIDRNHPKVQYARLYKCNDCGTWGTEYIDESYIWSFKEMTCNEILLSSVIE